MKKLLITFITTLTLFGCKQTADTTTTTVTKYIGCTKVLENQGTCIRWMDRTIYMAYSNASTPQRNNEFQKAKVKEALQEIQGGTMLGTNYFDFKEVDEGLLNPIIEPGLSPNQYKSFVLIWPDSDFNNFVVNTVGGEAPDPNAITIINSAYKRKFFMIIKASCFNTDSKCNGISTPGLKALIARQIGMLSGISPVNCDTDPNNVMCATLPTDAQWNEVNKNRWTATENNILEVIMNNPNFYDEYVPATN